MLGIIKKALFSLGVYRHIAKAKLEDKAIKFGEQNDNNRITEGDLPKLELPELPVIEAQSYDLRDTLFSDSREADSSTSEIKIYVKDTNDLTLKLLALGVDPEEILQRDYFADLDISVDQEPTEDDPSLKTELIIFDDSGNQILSTEIGSPSNQFYSNDGLILPLEQDLEPKPTSIELRLVDCFGNLNASERTIKILRRVGLFDDRDINLTGFGEAYGKVIAEVRPSVEEFEDGFTYIHLRHKFPEEPTTDSSPTEDLSYLIETLDCFRDFSPSEVLTGEDSGFPGTPSDIYEYSLDITLTPFGQISSTELVASSSLFGEHFRDKLIHTPGIGWETHTRVLTDVRRHIEDNDLLYGFVKAYDKAILADDSDLLQSLDSLFMEHIPQDKIEAGIIERAKEIIDYIRNEEGKEDKSKRVSISLPGYAVVKKLGNGQQGDTYKVCDRRSGKPSVLKIMDNKSDEYRILSYLQDTNLGGIVKVLSDLSQEGNRVKQYNYKSRKWEEKFGFIMGYVEGPTLKEFIDDGELPNETKATEISEGLFQAILGLTEHGLIHGDLKEENLIVTKETVAIDFSTIVTKQRATVIDFGVARFEEQRYEAGVHLNDSYLDTAKYWYQRAKRFFHDVPQEVPSVERKKFPAPKLTSLPEDFQGHFDLFSLGLLTYEMLTGEHLVLKRTASMRTTVHKDKVKAEKEEMREGGKLKRKYVRRVRSNIKKPRLRKIILECLSQEPNLAKIRDLYNPNYGSNRIKKYGRIVAVGVAIYLIGPCMNYFNELEEERRMPQDVGVITLDHEGNTEARVVKKPPYGKFDNFCAINGISSRYAQVYDTISGSEFEGKTRKNPVVYCTPEKIITPLPDEITIFDLKRQVSTTSNQNSQ